MKETIYISGPITGNANYMNDFHQAEDHLRWMGYKVINPAVCMKNLKDILDYEDMMTICFMMLDKADAMFMLNGWEKSPGAKREYAYGIKMQKKIVYEEITRIPCFANILNEVPIDGEPPSILDMLQFASGGTSTFVPEMDAEEKLKNFPCGLVLEDGHVTGIIQEVITNEM